MELSTAEKIRILAKRSGMPMSKVAEILGTSRQNLSNKLAKNNFLESELRAISEVLGCTYEAVFITADGERI